jgi:16S rRNA (cytosine967-C5)-methyltransferase
MRHPARLQAAIDLLDEIEQSLASDGAAADMIVKNYFRTRRYAGSKDRAAVMALVFAPLRRRAEILWRAGEDADARTRMITCLALAGEAIEEVFDGSPHAPAPLSGAELALVQTLRAAPEKEPPEWVAAECPLWLMENFRLRFGAHLMTEMAALNERAPLDLRVNLLKATVAAMGAELTRRNIAFTPCSFAPAGLRLLKNADLTQDPLYTEGKIEIQDEGAQVAAALAAAQSGERVVDLCAGAGGKTLALAADMENNGIIHAFDIVAKRLGELERRALRAGVTIIKAEQLPEGGPGRTASLDPLRGNADLVLLDVPCSGSGTWRRNPEARWRLTPDRLSWYVATQRALLDEGAGLVARGGRLLYITCSLLMDENESQITGFLAAHPDFRLIPYGEVWRRKLPGSPPGTLSSLPEALCLSPGSHGTDGFFVAALQKI